MKKNIFNFKVLLLLALFTGFMSCDKQSEIDDISDELTLNDVDLADVTEDVAELDFLNDFDSKPEQLDGGQRCFTPVYPVTIEFPDGSSQEVADKDAMRTASQTWKQNNPDVDGHPIIKLPFDATLADGSNVTFNSIEDIREVMEDCMGDRSKGHRFDRCFTPVFPITIVFPDGTTQDVDSQEALRTAMMEWKQNNSDVDGHPEFQFPIDVTLKDGTVVTVNTKEDLIEIAQGCKRDHKHKPHFGRCFKVVFPVTIEFPDGTTQEIDSKENLRTVLMDWKQNNPDVDGRPHLVFPFDVETKDGNIITINSKQELIDLMRRCMKKHKGKGGRGGHGNGGHGNGGNGNG